jgi:hypothetical protein
MSNMSPLEPGEEPTLVDVINRWRAEGFGADFEIEGGMLRCRVCNQTHAPEDAEILDVARFEGVSDPDDLAVAFALRCVHCGTRGILVGAYGPNASADEANVFLALRDGRPKGESS